MSVKERYLGWARRKVEGEQARFDPARRLQVGDRLKFASERQRYEVRALSRRFAVCTKPFNLQHTVRCTIIDLKEGIRVTDFGGESTAQCYQMLVRLETGMGELSNNRMPLDIEPVSYMRMLMREAGETA
jgi:hypothetical protein